MSIRCVDTDDIGELSINSVEHEDPDWRQYWDDVSGQVLDTDETHPGGQKGRSGVHHINEGVHESSYLPVPG